jgi:hypothetical protein
LMHIPAPRLHLVRYFGHYSSAARARRREPGAATERSADPSMDTVDETPSAAQRRRLRRRRQDPQAPRAESTKISASSS